jgi:hypothetical protein
MRMIQNACNLRYKDSYTSCYICHAKCKKSTKESYTYATKEFPHTQLKKSNTHQAPRKWVKVAWSRGLVKISASWSCVGTWIKAIFLPQSCLSNTTRKVFISDDLLVTLQTLITKWYVFHDEMSIFVISCMWRWNRWKNNDENIINVTKQIEKIVIDYVLVWRIVMMKPSGHRLDWISS